MNKKAGKALGKVCEDAGKSMRLWKLCRPGLLRMIALSNELNENKIYNLLDVSIRSIIGGRWTDELEKRVAKIDKKWTSKVEPVKINIGGDRDLMLAIRSMRESVRLFDQQLH